MNLAVKRLEQIFLRSSYKCDSVDTLKEGISFPKILLVSLYNYTGYVLNMCILQDLSQYQNDELLHESLHLLGRVFSAEENLFEKAIQTQVNNYIHIFTLYYFVFNSY